MQYHTLASTYVHLTLSFEFAIDFGFHVAADEESAKNLDWAAGHIMHWAMGHRAGNGPYKTLEISWFTAVFKTCPATIIVSSQVNNFQELHVHRGKISGNINMLQIACCMTDENMLRNTVSNSLVKQGNNLLNMHVHVHL